MPLTYGFRGYQPRAQTYVHPFTGAVIATPVLDLSSVLGPTGYADRSPTGANGAPVGAPANARGVYEDAIKFGGVRDALNCGSNAPLDIAGDISLGLWVCPRSAPAGNYSFLAKSDGAAAGWFLYIPASGIVSMYFYVGPTNVTGVNSILYKWTHVQATVQSSVCRLFIDGLQERRTAATMSDSAAASLYVGDWRGTSYWLDGLIELPQVWSGALSPEQVYRNYLQAKDVPIYYDTFESYAVTPVAKAAGSKCGPFRMIGGTSLVTVDAGGRHWVQGSGAGANDSSMKWPEDCAYGTYEFTLRKANAGSSISFMPIASSGTIPLLTAGQNGYSILVNANEAIAFYRVTGAGTTLLSFTANGYISNVDDYDFRLVRRVGGQSTVYLRGGAFPDWTLMDASASGTNPSTDNTYTAAPFCLATLGADDRISGIRFFRVCERPASFPWEFSTGTYSGIVSGSTVWMRCVTAGVTYLPKDLDWQTAIFGLYKGADANVTDVCFVASEIGGTTFANQNGYCLRMSADERLQLIRMSGGIETPVAETAAAYVDLMTEYQIKITHNGTTNAYDFFIQGGAYTTWTATGLSAVLGIHTSSNYWTQDLDASDRIMAPQFYKDLR